MIPDLYKDIKIQLYERATSPLLGSFVISWCLWNYKLLLVLISSGTAFEKIARIEHVLYPKFWWDGAWVGLFYPLMTTAFFIIVFPYPARFVFWITRYQQMKTKELQQKIEDETPLTQEESRKIKSELGARERVHDEDNANNRNIIDALKRDLETADGRQEKSNKKLQETEAELRAANAELSRRQPQNEKSSQAKSKANSTPDDDFTYPPKTHQETIMELNNILGNLTKIIDSKKKLSNVLLMKKILLYLEKGRATKIHILDEFSLEKSIINYTINNLHQGGYISTSGGEYYLSQSGQNLIIEYRMKESSL